MSRKYLRFQPLTDWRVGKTCLLITLVPFSVNSASIWNESSGKRTEVTSGYSSQEERDYPLFVSGEGSELVVNSPWNSRQIEKQPLLHWYKIKGRLP
ncbi:hypothetical protein [Mixta calida]|uniref:hypothetical protein n=1 Tax=Mixta calida TaxID=665913 RepID=UPI0011AFD5FE|nr:hypothetical protein [Mixta calida]